MKNNNIEEGKDVLRVINKIQRENEGALLPDGICYVTEDYFKGDIRYHEYSKDVHDLYKVRRTGQGWIVQEFTSFSGGASVRTVNIPIYEDGEKFQGAAFELDRVLLDRLYLLSEIAAARKLINESLRRALSREKSNGENFSSPLSIESSAESKQNSNVHPVDGGWRENISRVVAMSTGVFCLSAIFLIWGAVFDFNPLLVWMLRFLLLVALICAMGSFAHALHEVMDKGEGDKKLEEISDLAVALRSKLSQINLKVASGYAEIDGVALNSDGYWVPEGLIGRIDNALQIKASFGSLDKIISTQLQNVSVDHKRKQGQRLHAYQNVVSAGSGIFTGFFTYEVGDSVLKFVHASQYSDDRSLQYWLFTKAGVSASLQGGGQSSAKASVMPVVAQGKGAHVAQSKEIVPVQPADGGTSTEKESGHTPKVEAVPPTAGKGEQVHHTDRYATVTSVQSIDELDGLYHQNFVHHELFGQACLLTVTIVVTWFAGFIRWHKPHDEHGGGSAHHA